jgi:hypothetical protein
MGAWWSVCFICDRSPIPTVPPGRTPDEVARWLARIERAVGYPFTTAWEVA